MILIPQLDSLSHFSPETLIDLYHKLTFPQRAQKFEIFLPKDEKLPKINPPYSFSMFPEASRHCISLLSYLLGYLDDHSVDDTILGFLSIFNKYQQPAFMYNNSQFLADNIHEQFMNFTVRGVFSYSSVIVDMFLF